MRNYLLICISAAMMGAGWALWWTTPARQRVVAENPAPAAAPVEEVAQAPAPHAPATAEGSAPGGDDDQLTPEEQINVAVYDNVNRSVVNINTKSVSMNQFMMFEVPSEGAGSGSVLDKQGHILTNFHVVENAREIKVTLFDGRSYAATPVGADPASDIAVVQIKAPADSLYPITLGDSTHLKVGQRVFAIGNPFGLERTLTTGIISSLNRQLQGHNNRTIKSIIQTDAAINPGNSGGPLLDSHSRLIGMNTAIASRTGQSAGVGFAIPVATIARVVPQLIENGRVVRPETGIAQLYQTDNGVVIIRLAPDGPAEKAGLQGVKVVIKKEQQGSIMFQTQTVDPTAADTIVAVDGQKVRTIDQFYTLVESKQPGDTVTITVLRDGKRVDIPVKLSTAES